MYDVRLRCDDVVMYDVQWMIYNVYYDDEGSKLHHHASYSHASYRTSHIIHRTSLPHRLNVNQRSFIKNFQGRNFNRSVIDRNNFYNVKTNRIGTIRRSCREYSGKLSFRIVSGFRFENASVSDMQPC